MCADNEADRDAPANRHLEEEKEEEEHRTQQSISFVLAFHHKAAAFFGARNQDFSTEMNVVQLNHFFYGLCFWMSKSTLPFLAKDLGADVTLFSYLQTAFNIAQLLGSPIIGRIMDDKGPKYALLLTQASLWTALMLTGCAFNVPLLFLSQLPYLFVQTGQCVQAFVTNLSSEADRSTVMARMYFSYLPGLIIGALAGGQLAEAIGYRTVAFISGCLSSIPIALDIYLLPQGRIMGSTVSEAKTSLQWNEILQVIGQPGMKICLAHNILGVFAFSTLLSTIESGAPSYLNLKATELGRLQVVGALAGTLGLLFISFGVDKLMHDIWTITAWSLPIGIAMFSYGFCTKFADLAAVVTFLFLPSGVAATVFLAAVTKLGTLDNSATALGLVHGSKACVGAVCPLMGGMLLDQFHMHGIGIFTGICMTLAIAAVQLLWYLPEHILLRLDPRINDVEMSTFVQASKTADEA